MHKRIPILLGAILLVFSLWLQVTPIPSFVHFVNRLQNIGYDMQLRAHTLARKTPLSAQIAIVDIDDRSITREGRWPWSRRQLALLVDQIKAAGGVVVAFDIIFPEPELNILTELQQTIEKSQRPISPSVFQQLQKFSSLFDQDLLFAHSLSGIDSVLGISFLPRVETSGVLSKPLKTLTPEEKKYGFVNAEGYIGNLPILKKYATSGGFINVFPDDDGIIRRVPILIAYQDQLYPSLALEAVRQFLLSDIKIHTGKYLHESEIESISLGERIIPTDNKTQMIVPFRGPAFTFPYFSATDVMHQKIPVNSLQGKIIFVGTSATGLGDLKATAIQNIFPGVEIQATIAQSILDNTFYQRPAWAAGAEVFLTFFPGILFVFLFPYLGPRLLGLFVIIMPALFLGFGFFLWEHIHLIISVFMPIIATLFLIAINLIYGYMFEARKRENLKEIFGQYVPAKHIDEMLNSKDQHGLMGEDRDMTVLFADIRNFTSISESLSATELKEMLNDFFTPMTEIIFNHNGTIDKYVGDMIMAFWGAPLADEKHAQHALAAGLRMLKKVEFLRKEFVSKNWPAIQIGIGLNSGIMRVGDMGSRFRRSYTVLGDAVNLASRVEGLTKYYGVDFIVTEQTQKNQSVFVFRQLDRVTVKGKKMSLSIYEVIGQKKELSSEKKHELKMHHEALQAYFEQRWLAASALFETLLQQFPQTKIYHIYQKRLAEYLITPPPTDWNGTFIHTEK